MASQLTGGVLLHDTLTEGAGDPGPDPRTTGQGSALVCLLCSGCCSFECSSSFLAQNSCDEVNYSAWGCRDKIEENPKFCFMSNKSSAVPA